MDSICFNMLVRIVEEFKGFIRILKLNCWLENSLNKRKKVVLFECSSISVVLVATLVKRKLLENLNKRLVKVFFNTRLKPSVDFSD